MCLIRSTTRVEYPYSLSYLQTTPHAKCDPCAWQAADPSFPYRDSQEHVSKVCLHHLNREGEGCLQLLEGIHGRMALAIGAHQLTSFTKLGDS